MHARHTGARIDDFVVLLDDSEAIEALDYLSKQMQQATDLNLNIPLLMMDIQVAKETRDPWPVIAHFTMLGFHMQRRSEVLN